MPASEFRKKTVIFVIFAGIIVLLLVVLMPLFKEWLDNYLQYEFGITVTQGGDIVPKSGEVAPMVRTSVTLVYNLVRIVTILLWMALVISVVRFVGFAIVSRIRGSQSEVAS